MIAGSVNQEREAIVRLVIVHEATVDWAGGRRRALIDISESDPLLGMELLHGHELTIQVIAGGIVALRQLRLA